MIIKVGHRETPFIQIDKAVYNDARISYKAKGILTYLMGKPADWVAYETEIKAHSTEGIKSIRSGVKELIEFGYIIKTTVRNDKGQFKGYEWLVYDIPTERPKTECRQKHTTNIDSNNKDSRGDEIKYNKGKNGKLTTLHLEVSANMAQIEVNKTRGVV